MTKGYNKSPKPFSPLSGGRGGGQGFNFNVTNVLSREARRRGVKDVGTAPDGAEDPAVAAKRRREVAASKRKRGRLGTSLTGALGDPAEPSLKRRKLGG